MSRDYSKVSPRFWSGETGRALLDSGHTTALMGMYLMTCPNSNMIGLYYLPLPTICHELRITEKGALKALQRASEGGFATWDSDSQHVFVVEMAAYQIGEPLSAKDNRCKGIAKDWLSMRKSPFFMDFYKRYRRSFHLPEPPPQTRPFEGASKGLRSQEQEQEQKQEQDNKTPPTPSLSESELSQKASEVGALFRPEMVPIPGPLDSSEFRAAWQRWVGHSRQRSGRISQDSVTSQLVELADWGLARSITAIDYSIRKNYASIQEPKDGNRNQSRDRLAGQVYDPKRRIEEIF